MNSAIVVIGAGGHAKVCIEILRSMGETVAFCVGGPDSPQECLGVPILKGDENLKLLRSKGFFRLFPAIGENRTRDRLAAAALKLGYQLVNAHSPHAVISPTAKVGAGAAIMAGVVINADAIIEDLAIVNTGSTIDHDCRIRRAAHLAPQCALAGNVDVGTHTFLGVGCKVIPRIKIGDDVIIGAGAVVITDIESRAKAVGVPARITFK